MSPHHSMKKARTSSPRPALPPTCWSLPPPATAARSTTTSSSSSSSNSSSNDSLQCHEELREEESSSSSRTTVSVTPPKHPPPVPTPAATTTTALLYNNNNYEEDTIISGNDFDVHRNENTNSSTSHVDTFDPCRQFSHDWTSLGLGQTAGTPAWNRALAQIMTSSSTWIPQLSTLQVLHHIQQVQEKLGTVIPPANCDLHAVLKGPHGLASTPVHSLYRQLVVSHDAAVRSLARLECRTAREWNEQVQHMMYQSTSEQQESYLLQQLMLQTDKTQEATTTIAGMDEEEDLSAYLVEHDQY